MRARLKSGVFNGKDKQYKPGDVHENFEDVPKSFHDMWEVLPPRKTRESVPQKATKKKATRRKPSTTTTKKSTSKRKKAPAKK